MRMAITTYLVNFKWWVFKLWMHFMWWTLQCTYGRWCAKAFPHAHFYTITQHMKDEVIELCNEGTNLFGIDFDSVNLESADIVLLLTDLAYRHKYNIGDGVATKFKINTQRKWRVDERGCSVHVKDENCDTRNDT